jgi:hypothetical protein
VSTFLSRFRSSELRYQDGYKYRTRATWAVLTPFSGMAARIESGDRGLPWVELRQDGALIIREGYAWDGASGPTVDTRSAIIPSLVHDALYQLARAGRLPPLGRDAVDDYFESLCVACGMWRWRAKIWRRALKIGAAHAYAQQPERILVAP